MPPLNSFKKRESEVVDRLGGRLRNGGIAVVAFFRRVLQRGKQRFTVMFIPHSEKRIFNVQISVFTLLFVVFVSSVLVIAFIGFSTHFTTTNRELGNVRGALEEREGALEDYRNETLLLDRGFRDFQGTMDEILGMVDSEWLKLDWDAIGGEVVPLGRAAELQESSVRDQRRLMSIRNYFRTAQKSLGMLKRHLTTINTLIQQIPSGWPIAGGMGLITQYFGPAINPFYPGTWYLHKGIDIAWSWGSDIVATADGEVVFVEGNSAQYGSNIIVKHQYGYRTRYAHLSGIDVRTGQKVRRGDVIGALGSTGMSLGNHLHYEVMIGGQVVDPQAYLDLSDFDVANANEGAFGGR